MSNHNKIRPVDKNNLNGQYKILFSTPQTPNSNIPKEFKGLQIYPNKLKAEEALKNRKDIYSQGKNSVNKHEECAFNEQCKNTMKCRKIPERCKLHKTRKVCI